MSVSRRIFAVLVATCTSLLSIAQGTQPLPVQWNASLANYSVAKSGRALSVELKGTVAAGWHVYSQQEPANGPIPLRISVDENNGVELAGKVTGTKPTRHLDPGFQLETEFYPSDFTLSVPITLKLTPSAAASIPISVRYQACNDHVCLPPRTVHLSVPLPTTSGH